MTKIVLDASAWVEYLQGGPNAKEVDESLQEHDCLTNLITVAEVVSKVKRRGFDPQVALNIINSLTKTFCATSEDAFGAGTLHAEERAKQPHFGLGDSFLIVCARRLGAKILTNDHHFKRFKESIMLGKN